MASYQSDSCSGFPDSRIDAISLRIWGQLSRPANGKSGRTGKVDFLIPKSTSCVWGRNRSVRITSLSEVW